MQKLSVMLAGAGLAVAALAGALAGTAGAVPPPGGGTHGDTSGTLDPGLRHNTASANLDKLANSLAFYNKSVTAVLRAPAGLQVSRPVEVVAILGANAGHVSQKYSNTSGLRLAYDFAPGNGQPRREPVTIALTERDPLSNQVLASYTMHTSAEVQALWDVIVNPLRITFWDPLCDGLSDADPHVVWRDATGVEHDREFDPDPGDTVTIDQGFSGIWHEVAASAPLLQPSFAWHEHDLVTNFHPPAPSNIDQPLLPTEDQNNSIVIEEGPGGDCSAVFEYSVRVTVRTYPGLPNT